MLYKWNRSQLEADFSCYGCPDKHFFFKVQTQDKQTLEFPWPLEVTEEEVTKLWLWVPPWSPCRIYTLAISKSKVVICWGVFSPPLFIFPSDRCKAAVWVWLIESRSPPNPLYLCISLQRSQTEQEIIFTASSSLRLSLYLWVSPPCWDTFRSSWARGVQIRQYDHELPGCAQKTETLGMTISHFNIILNQAIESAAAMQLATIDLGDEERH